MSVNVLCSYTKDGTTHSASNDIESLVYVLIWMCALYAGLGALCKDKHINKTVLKTWVSVTNEADVSTLAGFKIGLKYDLSIVTDDFTLFFQPLASVADRLLKQLGQFSRTDHLLNYETIWNILVEGFGTVQEMPNWSGAKDVYGYGLLQQDLKHKHKLPSFVTGEYDGGAVSRNVHPRLR